MQRGISNKLIDFEVIKNLHKINTKNKGFETIGQNNIDSVQTKSKCESM